LITQGHIGEVVQVLNLAPHRLSAQDRPAWFFEKIHYGGIITDIGSHQVEQFLTYAGCSDATLNFASARNCGHPEYPGLEDFGEFSLTGDNGASFYSRVDWFTPDAMPVWGDGRTFIVGTSGSMEVRKYIDPMRKAPASVIHLVTEQESREINCLGTVGFPFFGEMILDVLNRTEKSMGQNHIFKAAEISLLAQEMADTS
jgi:predicted dehydrogenase